MAATGELPGRHDRSRGAVAPDAGLVQDAATTIASILADAGFPAGPLGADLIEPPLFFALQVAGIEVRDGQQVMLNAREIKSPDKMALLATAASMVDGVYWQIAEALKPGVRENEIVGSPTERSTAAMTTWRR